MKKLLTIAVLGTLTLSCAGSFAAAPGAVNAPSMTKHTDMKTSAEPKEGTEADRIEDQKAAHHQVKTAHHRYTKHHTAMEPKEGTKADRLEDKQEAHNMKAKPAMQSASKQPESNESKETIKKTK